MEKVNGLVQAVGTQFNGSVKVNDKWYSFSKGVKNTAKAGDSVVLTLKEWEFEGKKGLNISAVDVVAAKPAEATPVVEKSFTPAPKAEMSKDEWAAKDRRISRQGLIQVCLQVSSNFDKAVELANKALEYVNETGPFALR